MFVQRQVLLLRPRWPMFQTLSSQCLKCKSGNHWESLENPVRGFQPKVQARF